MGVHNQCILLLFEYEIFVEEAEVELVHFFPMEKLDSLMSSGSYKDCNHMESSKLCCFRNWSSWWIRLLYYYIMTLIVEYNFRAFKIRQILAYKWLDLKENCHSKFFFKLRSNKLTPPSPNSKNIWFLLNLALSDLQPLYGNGVFGNVYLLALDNTKR